jgi:hypothetical protein
LGWKKALAELFDWWALLMLLLLQRVGAQQHVMYIA